MADVQDNSDLGPAVDNDELGPVVSENDELGPVVEHAPSLGERVVGAGKAIGRAGVAIGKGIVESIASPAKAGHEFGLASQQSKQIAALRADESGTTEEREARLNYADALEGVKKESLKQGALATGEAAATYGTLPFGGGAVEGLAGKKLVEQAGKTLLGKVALHAAEGAVIGGAYGAVKGSVGEGAAAALEGKGAGQIFDATVHGAATEGLMNAAAGAVLSPVLHGVFAGGKKLMFGKQLAQEAMATAAAKTAAIDAFDKSFHPSMIGERFEAHVAAAKAAGTPDDKLAAEIVGKLMGVAPEEADPAIVAIMTKKLAQYREMSGARLVGSASALYPEVNLPKPEGVPPVEQRIPLTTDIEPTGGRPPQDIGTPVPPAQNPRPFAAGENVPMAPPEGFEPGLGAPAAAVPPAIAPEGVAPQPEAQQLIAPSPISQPLGVQPGPSVEPRPMELAPRPGAQPEAPATANITQGVPFTEVKPAPAPMQGATKATASVPKVKLSEGPSRSPADASFEMNSLGKPTGQAGWQAMGDVAYRTSMSNDGKTVELNYLENLGDVKGEGAAVLKKLVKVADTHQVAMTLDALPLPRGNGKGKIPLDKLIAFYKSHGFEIVEQGEGFAPGEGWATMRREPVPVEKVSGEVASALKAAAPDAKVMAGRIEGLTNDRAHVAGGNVTEGKTLVPQKAALFTRLDEHLGRIAKEADKRIITRRLMKGEEMQSGLNIDPEHLKDLSISAAAKIFQKGIRSTKALTEALVRAHGEWVRPLCAKAIESGRRMLERLIANDKPTAKQLAEIKAMYQSGEVGKDWYEKTWGWLQEHFGEDAEMVARFISATSLGNSTEGGATQTLKAYGQWKLGLPFEGHLNKVHAQALLKAVRGEVFGDGKAQGFLGALIGDENAVALDRHVMRVLGFKNAGKAQGKAALSNSTYKLYSSIIRDLAQEAGVSPRQYQAGLWVGKKIADEQVAEHVGVATRGGSFRPMEHLISERLDGLSPSDWVERNKVYFQSIRNAHEGVVKARANGGHSFHPADFSEFKKPGFTVTLDHKVVPLGEASGMAVIDHAKRYKDLTSRFFGAHTGLYMPAKMGETAAEMHMDFNVHIPDHPANLEFAKKLGLENRQYAVGYTDAAGKYHDVATGYDPAVHGEQFPPRRVAEIEAQLEKMGFPTKDDPAAWSHFLPPTMSEQGRFQFDPDVHQFAVDNPAFALDKYAQVAGKTPEEIKVMINDGMFKPMTDAGVAGGVFVNKDGIVHQYIDPVAPSYNTTQVFGSLRKNPVEMLNKLKGMDILRGHDIVEQYRTQAGAVGGGKVPSVPKAAESAAKLTSKMLEIGGKVRPLSAAIEEKRMSGFWMTPDGRLIQVPYTHEGHARAMGIALHKGAENRTQTVLTAGFVRIQSGGGAQGIQVGSQITDRQRSLLKRILDSSQRWSAEVLDKDGRSISIFTEDADKVHHFLAAASK